MLDPPPDEGRELFDGEDDDLEESMLEEETRGEWHKNKDEEIKHYNRLIVCKEADAL